MWPDRSKLEMAFVFGPKWWGARGCKPWLAFVFGPKWSGGTSKTQMRLYKGGPGIRNTTIRLYKTSRESRKRKRNCACTNESRVSSFRTPWGASVNRGFYFRAQMVWQIVAFVFGPKWCGRSWLLFWGPNEGARRGLGESPNWEERLSQFWTSGKENPQPGRLGKGPPTSRDAWK
jgi:hypothetical protein